MTHNETMLEKIKAVLEDRITADVENYEIKGRKITKIPIDELIKLKEHYQAKVNQDNAAADVAAGLGNPNSIKVRF